MQTRTTDTPILLSILTDIRSDLQQVQARPGLEAPRHFSGRAAAIDFLEFHVLDRMESLNTPISHPELIALKDEALRIKAKLEQVDKALFRGLREAICNRKYTPATFLQTVNDYLGAERILDLTQSKEPGYDEMDFFFNALLSEQILPEVHSERETGMVFYQKTPARVILQLTQQAAFSKNDVFFDLGSGLGQVCILVHLLTGVPATGIEYEPACCRYATVCAQQLDLPAVTFINQDARKADYSGGTVFFMYTPFEGGMLQQVLLLLKHEAARRAIRIFTYGPCSVVIAAQSWLDLCEGNANNPYSLCRFTSK
ncbi:class I SAM-dependent methyltransferase [Taibaiella koreensis]|uniref:hypothetical protein n=1 Tax=Taibaiella koreensis TaxID=1268548 RepID=UPI0013C32FF5|nr:hypothetical protein [Taibaiella koreensis]